MIADLLPHFTNLAFRHDVAAAHEYDTIGDPVDFFENVAGNDDVHSLHGKCTEQSDGLGACDGIQPVERLVQNKHRGMVGDGLRQTDALAHTLAVSSHLAPRDLRHAGPLQGLVGQPCGLLTAKTMEPQGPKNEIITSGPWREGIELRAISNLPEQLHRLTRG